MPKTVGGKVQRRSRRSLGQGIAVRGQSREMICALRAYFEREKANGGPLLSVNKVVDRTAAALHINKNTVVKVGKEQFENEKETGESLKLTTPGKKRSMNKRVTNVDSFAQDAIRRHIYDYYRRKEHPTLCKLLVTLQEAGLFEGSRTSLFRVLHNLGFHYGQFCGRKLLMEREDIAAWRCRFLRQIRSLNIDEVVWLDETWVNSGHIIKQGWTDDTTKGIMPMPSGKGGRLILLHAGTSQGFVPNSLLLFKSKKTGDYHEEMNHVTFTKWFTESLIPNLARPSTIVLDNAPYHSVVVDKAPTMAKRKVEMIAWLQRHNVDVSDDLKKVELMEKINLHKPQFPKYEIDELAKKYGHTIIRLPPYHCHFNPIELIWAQIKGYVARNNKKFTLSTVETLTKEAISHVTSEDWKKAVKHTHSVMESAWQNEGVLETAVEEMIVSLNDNSGSETSSILSSDETDVSGVFPLSP